MMIRPFRTALVAFGIIAVIALYLANVGHNPPGFYIDESSIAYNAYTVSQTGCDEYGVAWPLYFRAFGEYKNGPYIYLLAAVYRLTGPSIAAARMFNAVLGLLAALAMGILAARIARRTDVGMIVGLIALFTPWLFELSRIVLEVAAYPLTVTLFLLVLHRASTKPKWTQFDVLRLALTLALLTYTYSIGRLLAPLLALGLIVFVNRERLFAILETWAAYFLTLIPLLIFHVKHPGALLARFSWVTYITPEITRKEIVFQFIKHYLANVNPWKLVFVGDSSPNIHIPTMGSLLVAPALLTAAGIVIILRRYRSDPWWRFILYGVVVSPIPASLTRDDYPSLRLITLPVLLSLLAIPVLLSLIEKPAKYRARRVILALFFAATALQIAMFQWRFHRTYRDAQARIEMFDVGFPEVLSTANALGLRPIYIIDYPSNPGYIHSYWYGVLQGLDASQFLRLPSKSRAPAGAVVITNDELPLGSKVIATSPHYTAYIAAGL